ncbi:unnamed protein product, partial [Gongylonema pulchrum]|uniref:Dopey_N domain-containing protein n=1 Tax=Gongylonema pulchrum TaxID=637853 RepID=A0A183D5Z1_9BILA
MILVLLLQMSSVLVGGTDVAAGAAQAASLSSNSKYRSYVAAVFQANAKFGDIPKAVTVAKRLSQCLHPALPHGVHLKALATYQQLFDILGRKDLPELLYLFAVGLFP